jgi:TraG P-loop domain
MRTRSSRHERASARRRTDRPAVRQAGELLAVEAIDRSGLLVTSEGVLVRYLHVIPPNPLILSHEEQAATAAAYCQCLAHLRAPQCVQFYVESRPTDLTSILSSCRAEVERWAGPPPDRARLNGHDPLALDRWRLAAAMEETLRLHADEQAAVALNAYVVVPFVPVERGAGALLSTLRTARARLPAASLRRDLRSHQRAQRESLALTDAIRSELDAIGLQTKLLNGEEVAALLWARLNPTSADGRGTVPARRAEIFGSLDHAIDAAEARRAARRLKERLATSPIDFKTSKHVAEVERDAVQTIYAQTTADATHLGWLMSAMLTRQPFCLSVFVHSLDRRRERQKLKLRYRRLYGVNRGAESRGRVPDFDRYQAEQESQQLLAEMAGHERTGIYKVSIYQTIRARGPQPDLATLTEAVDYCAEQIESQSDCKVNRGTFEQEQLWITSLPLGRDVAGRVRRYATRNVGDTVPLLGTGCGSPTGIPFAFSTPGRELQLFDPFDRVHANHAVVITGRSGKGKTMAANVLGARMLAHGARGFVLDRAGHFLTLVRQVHGARHIDFGADDSQWAINPWDTPDPGNVGLEKLGFLTSLHAVLVGEPALSTLERAQLGAAIRAVYATAAVTGVAPRESMLRDELRARAEHERAQGGDMAIASVLRNLAERLGEFVGDGSYAYLLDRTTNVPTDSPLVVFDIRRCPEALLKPVMFFITEFVTRAVERHRDESRHLTSRPHAPMFAGRSFFFIDEAWNLLARDETGPMANSLARQSRHLGLALVALSQHLSDFDSKYGLALLRNATQLMFLAPHPDDLPFITEAVGISDEEARVLSRLKTVRAAYSQIFWINGDRGRGTISLPLGPSEYWAYTSDPIRDVPLREARIAEHGGEVWAAIHDLACNEPLVAAA